MPGIEQPLYYSHIDGHARRIGCPSCHHGWLSRAEDFNRAEWRISCDRCGYRYVMTRAEAISCGTSLFKLNWEVTRCRRDSPAEQGAWSLEAELSEEKDEELG